MALHVSNKEAIERGWIEADPADKKTGKGKVIYRTLPPVPYPVPDKRMTVGRAIAFIFIWFLGFAMGVLLFR